MDQISDNMKLNKDVEKSQKPLQSQGSRIDEKSAKDKSRKPSQDQNYVSRIATKKNSITWTNQHSDSRKLKKENADLGEVDNVNSECGNSHKLKQDGHQTTFYKDNQVSQDKEKT